MGHALAAAGALPPGVDIRNRVRCFSFAISVPDQVVSTQCGAQ
jgi:hypothetical protein